MRRKKGTLLPLEVSILQVGIDLAVRGASRFHGFMIAKEIKDREDARLLTAHGTLYKALDRLQKSGFLESDWEDPLLAAREGRPRRRLYHVTAAGEAALVEALKAPQTARQTALRERRPGMASV
jgi:DNA-binding PadR family transcriptional regulator